MFPIRDINPSRHTPFATLALIAANVFFFFRELALPPEAANKLMYFYGLVPTRFLNPEWAATVGFPVHTYWPFLTTMFLHAGWLHIIGNMWVLWIFGDNVEDRMGPPRFLGYYLLCGVAAGFFHVITNPASKVPAVGASGAIAGVMAAYLVLFPKARIVAVLPPFFWLRFTLPAYLFLGFWFLIQFFSGTLAITSQHEVGGIAWWAHVGGFVTGLLTFWIFLRPHQKEPVNLAL